MGELECANEGDLRGEHEREFAVRDARCAVRVTQECAL